MALQYHTKLNDGDIAPYVLLPGGPKNTDEELVGNTAECLDFRVSEIGLELHETLALYFQCPHFVD